MNARLLIKLVFVLLVLLFMVMMGKSNNDPVRFQLNAFNYVSGTLHSAYMYFIFFGVGVITGGVIAAGGGKSSAPKSK